MIRYIRTSGCSHHLVITGATTRLFINVDCYSPFQHPIATIVIIVDVVALR
jgi:hypothetical protein